MKDPFLGYDQWKTTSPDDYYDDTICATCGTTLPDNPQPGTVEFNGFCSIECVELDTSTATEIEQLEEELESVSNRLGPIFDDFFIGTPDGDFEWKDEPSGLDDSNVWRDNDGEDDPSAYYGWKLDDYVISVGRKEGIRYIIVEYGVGYGGWITPDWDWETESEYTENDVDQPWFEQEWQKIAEELALDPYFRGWAEYYLWCAKYNIDPLGVFTKGSIRQRSIDAAKEMIKYLKMGR